MAEFEGPPEGVENLRENPYPCTGCGYFSWDAVAHAKHFCYGRQDPYSDAHRHETPPQFKDAPIHGF